METEEGNHGTIEKGNDKKDRKDNRTMGSVTEEDLQYGKRMVFR